MAEPTENSKLLVRADPISEEPTKPVGKDSRKRVLPIWMKLVYGLPQFAGAGLNVPIQIFLVQFYIDVVGLPLKQLAIAMAIARACDALMGPLIGWLSDNFQLKVLTGKRTVDFGRRRPYMVIGTVICASCFIALFNPPPKGDRMIIWFAMSLVGFYFGVSTYWVPYVALGAELTPHYDERTTLFAVKELFSIAGILTASIFPGILLMEVKHRTEESSDAHRIVYSTLSLSFGFCLVALFAVLVTSVKEKPMCWCRCSLVCTCGVVPEHLSSNPILPGLRKMMRNRPFVILVPVIVLAQVNLILISTMLPFFVTYILKPEREELWQSIFLGALFLAGFISVPVWLVMSWYLGKKLAFLISWGPLIFVGFGILLIGNGDEYYFLVMVTCMGLSGGGWNFLLLSMQSDVIEYDELYTGMRREAQFLTVWSAIPKFIAIPAAAVPLSVMRLSGYVPNKETQSSGVLLVIKLMMGPVPALLGALSFATILAYPLTKQVHARITKGILLHRSGQPALDPISGHTVQPPRVRGPEAKMTWFLDYFSKAELVSIMLFGLQGTHIARNSVCRMLLWTLLCLFCIWTLVMLTTDVFTVSDALDVADLIAVTAIVLLSVCFVMLLLELNKLVACWKLPTCNEDALKAGIEWHLRNELGEEVLRSSDEDDRQKGRACLQLQASRATRKVQPADKGE